MIYLKYHIYIGILSICLSCGRGGSQLRTGDLLFRVGGTSKMSTAITEATGKGPSLSFTHVGIVLHRHPVDSILEAAPDGGVRIIGLNEFLGGSTPDPRMPRAVAMRLLDTTGVAAAVARARNFIGQPYDYSYMPNNDKMYCSELVWESYLAPNGEHRFTARPMNFRAADGSMPPFWIELFEGLGEKIPEGVPGTNPNDMAREAILEEVCRYY